MSNEKRLFPGVTQQEIAEHIHQTQLAQEAARLAEEKKQREAAIAKEQKQKNDARNAAYRKYVQYKGLEEYQPKSKKDRADTLGAWAVYLLFWGILAAFGLMAQPERDFLQDKKVPVKQRLRDAFWPISNGWYVSREESYFGDDYNFIYRYSDSKKGKFAPRGVWFINMAFLSVTICSLIASIKQRKKEKAKIREQNSAAIAYNQASEDTVDMMLTLKEFGQQYNLDSVQVKKLVEIVPDVISRMSEAERVWFDMLMDGSLEIADKETYRGIAISIMQGHLKTHPEDAQKVMEIYDMESIPDEIRKMMRQYQK